MTYIPKPILIETKTNLHVGSGDMNYDIVDKRVQRDSISHLPIINSSSFKGALRSHFDVAETVSCMADDGRMDFIFGSDDENNGSQGYVKFLDSYLLFLPLRSDKRAYYHATSEERLLEFCDFFEELGFDMKELKAEIRDLDENTVFDPEAAHVEDILCNASGRSIENLKKLFGDIHIAILSSELFNDAVEHLPIIARNRLKEKQSKNLWYEEIVPRRSIFYTSMLDYSNYGVRVQSKANYSINCFYKEMEHDYVQIGANGSIGFGLCKIKQLELMEKEEQDVQ